MQSVAEWHHVPLSMWHLPVLSVQLGTGKGASIGEQRIKAGTAVRMSHFSHP